MGIKAIKWLWLKLKFKEKFKKLTFLFSGLQCFKMTKTFTSFVFIVLLLSAVSVDEAGGGPVSCVICFTVCGFDVVITLGTGSPFCVICIAACAAPVPWQRIYQYTVYVCDNFISILIYNILILKINFCYNIKMTNFFLNKQFWRGNMKKPLFLDKTCRGKHLLLFLQEILLSLLQGFILF